MLNDIEKVITDVYTLLKKKNDMYGDSNIEKHGVQGIIIRLDDKMSRIKNLLGKDVRDEESLIDTAMDMIGYLVHFIRLEKKTPKRKDKIAEIITQLENLSPMEKVNFLKQIDNIVFNNKKGELRGRKKQQARAKADVPYKLEPKEQKLPIEEEEGFTIVTFPEKLSVKDATMFFAEFYSEDKIKYDIEGDILYVDGGILKAGIKGNKIILSLPMDEFNEGFLNNLIDKYNIVEMESTTSKLSIT